MLENEFTINYNELISAVFEILDNAGFINHPEIMKLFSVVLGMSFMAGAVSAIQIADNKADIGRKFQQFRDNEKEECNVTIN